MAGMTLKSPKAPKTPHQVRVGGGTGAARQKSLTVPVPTRGKKSERAKKK
jgi:hypothetical protein